MRGKMEAGGNDSKTRSVAGVTTGPAQMPRRSAQQTQLPFRLEMNARGKCVSKLISAVSGLKLPYLTETKVQGVGQTEKIEVEEVAVNAGVEDSRFAKLQ